MRNKKPVHSAYSYLWRSNRRLEFCYLYEFQLNQSNDLESRNMVFIIIANYLASLVLKCGGDNHLYEPASDAVSKFWEGTFWNVQRYPDYCNLLSETSVQLLCVNGIPNCNVRCQAVVCYARKKYNK